MNTIKLKTFVVAVFASWITPLLSAGEISGTFVFESRKPFVALVYLADDKSGAKEICGPLDQKNKEFSSRLIIGREGSEINFKNSDEMNHNIFANDTRKGIQFDVGLLSPGSESNATINWEEGHVVRVGCKIHPKMRSYIANINSSYAAIIEFDSEDPETTFTISGLPDDVKEIVVWFPRMENLSFVLSKGDSKNMDIIRNDRKYGELIISRI